jgi:hypothetical protein
VIVHDEPTAMQLGDQAMKGEITGSTPFQEPYPMIAQDLSRLVTTHLAGARASRFATPTHPVDHRAHPELKLGRDPTAGLPIDLDQVDHPLA